MQTLWFILIGFMIIMYVVLDGFDLGAGAIHPFAAKNDEERRLIGLDLHDGLTQLVISANMHLNALNALGGSRLEPPAQQELDVSRFAQPRPGTKPFTVEELR